jgi:hypothetical protein
MAKVSKWATAACALVLAAGPANASTWVINYASIGGNPTSANLRLIVDDTANPAGTYAVLAVSGDVDGDAVTGLTPNWSGWNLVGSPDGMFVFDNVFSPTGVTLTNGGLMFNSASYEYNLFSDSPTQYELYRSDHHSYVANSLGSIEVERAPPASDLRVQAVAGVPEPVSWVLLITGFGGLGAAFRAKRRRFALIRAGLSGA